MTYTGTPGGVEQASSDGGRELVMLAVPGVQSFIESSRTTADLYAASQIRVAIMRSAVGSAEGASGAVLVFPPTTREASSNRLVVDVPAGMGQSVGTAAAEAAAETWRKRVGGGPLDRSEDLAVVWVVSAGDDEKSRYTNAQRALSDRRRLRDFAGRNGANPLGLCHMCGEHPASWTPAALEKQFLGEGERLCRVCLTKRWHKHAHPQEGFPSTSAISSGPYRRAVLSQMTKPAVAAAVDELVKAVKRLGPDLPRPASNAIPGLSSNSAAGTALLSIDGQWCYPESWQTNALNRELKITGGEELAKHGADAARSLQRACGDGHLTPYYAIVALDADQLGRRLGDLGSFERQIQTAQLMSAAAVTQQGVVEHADQLGRLVFAGGDDVLALLPATTALRAASLAAAGTTQELRTTLPDVTVSGAIAYVHRTYPFGPALRLAREALKSAKDAGRNRLAVVVVRRGGERARSILPWTESGREPVGDLVRVASAFQTRQMSEGVLRTLTIEAAGLAAVGARVPSRVQSELRRLVDRHIDSNIRDDERIALVADLSGAMYGLMRAGSVGGRAQVDLLVEALTVARFIAKEAQ